MKENKVLQPQHSVLWTVTRSKSLIWLTLPKASPVIAELNEFWIKDHEEVRVTDSFSTDKEPIRDLSVPHKFESKLKKSCWEGREQGTGQRAEGDLSINEYLVEGRRRESGVHEAGKKGVNPILESPP